MSVKTSVQNKFESAKDKVVDYKEKISLARLIGYDSGVKDASRIPKTTFSRSASIIGYTQGINHKYKADRYAEKVRKNSH